MFIPLKTPVFIHFVVKIWTLQLHPQAEGVRLKFWGNVRLNFILFVFRWRDFEISLKTEMVGVGGPLAQK